MSVRKIASLSFALALVYSISLPARAELLKNLKTDGSIETRSYSVDNLTDRNGTADDYISQTNVRIMVGASFDLLDDVHSRILLDNASGGSKAVFGTGPGNIGSQETAFSFDNAYVKIDKVFGHVDMTIGQQFYNDPSDLVIYFGPQNNDVLSVTSLSAFRADTDLLGVAKFQGIAGKTADNASQTSVLASPNPANSNSDTDIWGAEVNTDKLIPSGNLAVYYYDAQTKKQANAVLGNNTLNVFGVRLRGDIPVIGGLGYRAEFIQNTGRNNGVAATPAYDGTAYDLGLSIGETVRAFPVRAHIDFARGSRDFASIAAGRRYGIIWGEHTAVAADPSNLNGVGGAGITNLKVLDAGVGVSPIPKLGLDLNAYRFWYGTSASGKTNAGTEYDLIVSWKHSDNVSFEVNAATFQVGDALQNAGPTSPITRLGADVKIKY